MSSPPPPPAGPTPFPGWGVAPPGPGPATPGRGPGCLLRGLGCLPLLFGILFLAGGVVWASAFAIPSGWAQTQGTVSELLAQPAITNFQGTTYFYLATVAYDVDGQAHEVDTPVQTRTPMAVGDRTTVAYDPGRPADARVVDSQPAYSAWIFVAVGGPAVVVGLVLLAVGPLRILAFADRRIFRRGRG